MSNLTNLGFQGDDVLVVTGGASGIGLAAAEAAVSLGLRVVIIDLDEPRALAAADRLKDRGGRTIAFAADTADERAVERVLSQATDTFGALRYLVNNAGPPSSSNLTFNQGIERAIGSINVVTEAWLQRVAEGGSVVHVASIVGAILGTGSAHWYAASKAAICGYSRFLAVSRPKGIRSNTVAPGQVATPRNLQWLASGAGQATVERNPMKRAASPAEVAAAILFLCSPAAAYINGVLLPVDGGLTLTW